MWVGLAMWLLETAFFGWHATSHSTVESFFNQLSLVLILYGIVGSWLKSFKTVINIKTGALEIK